MSGATLLTVNVAQDLDDRSRELNGRREFLDAKWARLYEGKASR